MLLKDASPDGSSTIMLASFDIYKCVRKVMTREILSGVDEVKGFRKNAGQFWGCCIELHHVGS